MNVNKKRNLLIWGKLFLDVLKTAKFHCVFGIICVFLNGIIPSIVLIFLTKIYDIAELYVNGGCTKNELLCTVFLLIMVYLVKKILDFFSSISINAFIYEKCKNQWLSKIIETTSDLELIKFEDANVIDEIQRVKDIVHEEVPSSLFINVISIISMLLNIISITIILGTYNLFLVVLSILSVIPFFVSQSIRGNDFYKLKLYQSKKNRTKQYFYSLFADKNAVQEMKIFGAEDYISDKFVNCRNEIDNEVWNFKKKDSFSLLMCEIVKLIMYGVSICFVVYLISQKSISIAVLGACLIAIQNVQNSLKNILIKAANINIQSKMVNDFYFFLENNKQVETITTSQKINIFNELLVKNLKFAYPNTSNFVINDISFKINKGEKVAIVGKNGSGKTTLIKLILGIYHPDFGGIYYNDISLKNDNRRVICDLVSICQQKYTKYKLTLKENIIISDINKKNNDKELIELLDYLNLGKNFYLNDVLSSEFDGVDLSEGQWQKIAIARACYKENQILVADEPTASIDPLAESDILMKILDISKNSTLIIVSHRLSVCKLVDKIIVLENGEIAGIGTHNELINNNNIYQELFFAQQKWYKEE